MMIDNISDNSLETEVFKFINRNTEVIGIDMNNKQLNSWHSFSNRLRLIQNGITFDDLKVSNNFIEIFNN
jgi:hypothetical protein